jgi:tRNA1Val (adenine37-N6)-methyltransferase
VANPYFQCKQFIVHQEYTAMKVCTDACLFGAWAAADPSIQTAKNILDIGSGTGLLSLMLAQQSAAHITAIEIEADAFKQTKANFELSPWKERLDVIHNSIQDYASKNKESLFDCIITNPPFYEQDLTSPDHAKNLASHSTALSWDDLVKSVATLLQENGTWYVLVPTLRAYTMQKIASNYGLYLSEECLMYNDAKHLPIRAMLKFVKQKETVIERNKIVIKNADQSYTAEFTNYLKEYYLHL